MENQKIDSTTFAKCKTLSNIGFNFTYDNKHNIDFMYCDKLKEIKINNQQLFNQYNYIQSIHQ